MLKTTVYLDEAVAMALRQLSIVQGRSQAEIIRTALEAYTNGTPRPLPKGMSKYRSGETDVAQRAKQILGDAAKRRRWR